MKTVVRVVLCLLPACAPAEDSGEERDPEAILAAKAGTYEGTWTMSGLDPSLAVIPAMDWTDVAVSDQPTFEDERAYLHVTDSSMLEGGMTFEQMWIEGVLLDEDGLAGDEFIEMNGVVTIVEEVEPDRYRYEQELGPQDFYFLGPVTAENLTAGHHVVEKTVTFPDGVETHDIVRNTHLEWSDEMGPHTIDFESLVGQHRKTE